MTRAELVAKIERIRPRAHRLLASLERQPAEIDALGPDEDTWPGPSGERER